MGSAEAQRAAVAGIGRVGAGGNANWLTKGDFLHWLCIEKHNESPANARDVPVFLLVNRLILRVLWLTLCIKQYNDVGTATVRRHAVAPPAPDVLG